MHAVALGCWRSASAGCAYATTQLAANATADVVYTVLAMLAAVACGRMYQGPPFGLSYKGLGEPRASPLWPVGARHYLAPGRPG